MAHRTFCTYFDHRYISRGIALYHSLVRTCPDFTLWVLALTKEAQDILEKVDLKNMRVVSLDCLEQHDPDLRAARPTRSLIEYYFTCSPCLPRYLLDLHPDIDSVTYLDSDLFFFSSPDPIFKELESSSVGITPHRFTESSARSHGRFGRYNVGWLTFRRDEPGLACLNWWRLRCLEWCYDRPENDRYADQKYLEQFEGLFQGVHAIENAGSNVAPWNVGGHNFAHDSTSVTVDGSRLIFFHFQGLRSLTMTLFDSNLGSYGTRLSPVLRERIFLPYIRALQDAERFLAAIHPTLPNNDGIRRKGKGLQKFFLSLGMFIRTIKSALTNNLIRA